MVLLWVENRVFFTSYTHQYLHSMHRSRDFVKISPQHFVRNKTRTVEVPESKTFYNMFTRFERIHQRIRRMDRQTPPHGIGCVRIATRSKNWKRRLPTKAWCAEMSELVSAITPEKLYDNWSRNQNSIENHSPSAETVLCSDSLSRT